MEDNNSPSLGIAAKNRAELAAIKRDYDTGKIDREEAKRLAQPILDRINTRSVEVAKRFSKSKYYKLDFVSAMRSSY